MPDECVRISLKRKVRDESDEGLPSNEEDVDCRKASEFMSRVYIQARRSIAVQLALASRRNPVVRSRREPDHVRNPNSFNPLKLLTYNLWFREDVVLEERMEAIGDIIAEEGFPHFICFQEATPNIRRLLGTFEWYNRYVASRPPDQEYFTMLLCRRDVEPAKEGTALKCFEMPFENSRMGRSLLTCRLKVLDSHFAIATSHLESPCGGQKYSNPRVAQCRHSIELLDAFKGSVLFAGDMNWQKDDGKPPLAEGWCDAWEELHPNEDGCTYDTKGNAMVKGVRFPPARLDRIFCRLRGWELSEMKRVGMTPIKNTMAKIGLRRSTVTVPAYPSDHYGLVVTLKPTTGEGSGKVVDLT